jgi:hypothetical protein
VPANAAAAAASSPSAAVDRKIDCSRLSLTSATLRDRLSLRQAAAARYGYQKMNQTMMNNQ